MWVACVQEEMDFAAAELEAVQSRFLALEAEKNSLAARLEANRQEAAASSEVGACINISPMHLGYGWNPAQTRIGPARVVQAINKRRQLMLC
jgi:hypothetical protein